MSDQSQRDVPDAPSRPEEAALTPIDADLELLELAHVVLERAGYVTSRVAHNGLPLLLAENADIVLSVAATVTVEAAVRAEPVASRALIDRLGSGADQSKLWDAYVALLTSQRRSAESTQVLFDVAYNLRHVRRLVRAGVATTLASVERALRPVLPLKIPQVGTALPDPLDALRDKLAGRGLNPEEVSEEIALFRAAARLPRGTGASEGGEEDGV